MPNENIIRSEMGKLKNKVKLLIFTDIKANLDGIKTRKSYSCESLMNLINKLRDYSEDKLTYKEISIEENKEVVEKFNVSKVPTIIFVDEQERDVIRYAGEPTGNEFVPFLRSLQIFSGVNSYYKDSIQENLKKIPGGTIKVFESDTCQYCPQIIPLVNEFATLSKGKIKSIIIDVNANPDLAQRYNVMGIPHTVINDKDSIIGLVNYQDLLEKLTKGIRQDLGGMYG